MRSPGRKTIMILLGFFVSAGFAQSKKAENNSRSVPLAKVQATLFKSVKSKEFKELSGLLGNDSTVIMLNGPDDVTYSFPNDHIELYSEKGIITGISVDSLYEGKLPYGISLKSDRETITKLIKQKPSDSKTTFVKEGISGGAVVVKPATFTDSYKKDNLRLTYDGKGKILSCIFTKTQ